MSSLASLRSARIASPDRSKLRCSNLRLFAIRFCLYLPLIIALQYITGIYQSELSHQPDESAHVVTSLLIHDYLKTGLGSPPMRFAETYYVHYPKVAFGMWPPVFHSTAALWMLLFTRSHTSLLIFIAVQCALCATTLASFAQRFFPSTIAFALGLFLILLPEFQSASTVMMVDLFLTMMELWAMLLLIAFFRSGSMKLAVWFGVVTSLAMLTKGNANDLVLFGVILLLLTRQFSLLKHLPVYVAGAIIIVLGLPWQIVSLRLLRNSVPMEPLTISRFWMLSSGYTAMFIQMLSLPLFLFAVIGLAVICVQMLARRRSEDPKALDAAGAASLVLAIFLFHCVSPTPGPDDRYIIPALPLLVLFAGLGIRWVVSVVRVPRLSLSVRAAVLTLLCLGWFAKSTFAITPRPALGFSKAATGLLPAHFDDEVVLICSDVWGEGALITSLALGDRPGHEHIVLRGSKILSENPWDLVSYRPYFQSSSELESYFEAIPLDAIMVDLSNTLWEADRNLLRQTLQDNPSKWMLVTEIAAGNGMRHLQLYRWTGSDHSHIRKTIRVRMPFTLDRDLQLK